MKAALTCLTLAIVAFTSLNSMAVTVGASLPIVTIDNKGELTLSGDKVTYRPWTSESLTGKVYLLQYMAGRMAASKLNEPLTDTIDALDLPAEYFQSSNIINLNDALFGTSGFVNSELKKNKKAYPDASIIADKKGSGAKQWQLQAKSSAIFVISPMGKVLYFKDGPLTAEEIDQVITMVKQQIELLINKPLAAN